LQNSPEPIDYLFVDFEEIVSELVMSKTHRKIKKANHGRRPANAKARRKKRWIVKT